MPVKSYRNRKNSIKRIYYSSLVRLYHAVGPTQIIAIDTFLFFYKRWILFQRFFYSLVIIYTGIKVQELQTNLQNSVNDSRKFIQKISIGLQHPVVAIATGVNFSG
jgi:hypothetical protein